MIPEWTIADRMRKARESAGVSGKQMATELGVTPHSVSRWENGKREPARRTLMAYALRTGVPLEWLENGELVGAGADVRSR